MTDYTKTVNFAIKDSLPSGNPKKQIKGSEHEIELLAIQTAIASKADKIGSPTASNLVSQDANGNLQDAGLAVDGLGGLIDVQVFTSSGTWTTPSGCTQVILEVQAGGGGAGSTTGAAGWTMCSGAGGGGGWCLAHITSGLGSSQAVTVGSGGTASTGSDGGVGGDSSFGSFVTCDGGAGGVKATNSSGLNAGGAGGTGASVVSGAASYVAVDGAAGDDGYSVNATSGYILKSSKGGSPGGPRGIPGASEVLVSTGSGRSLTNDGRGAGGGGAIRLNSGADTVGRSGSSGIVIVRSYR